MERKIFEKKWQEASTTRDPLFVQKVQQSNEQLGRETKLVVCMEELAELFQALSKSYRKKEDRLNLIEELGDQLICVESMRQFYDIPEKALSESFASSKRFVSEQQKSQASDKNTLAFYMTEVIEISHIFSKCFTEDFSRPQMLSLLCSLLICVDNLSRFYGITEEELNKDINVKMDRGIS